MARDVVGQGDRGGSLGPGNPLKVWAYDPKACGILRPLSAQQLFYDSPGPPSQPPETAV